jgi:predicted RNA-binding Zn ribbon-like protein
MQTPAFLFVADDLALDFLNTAIQGQNGSRDMLTAPAAITAWLDEARLLTSEERRMLDWSPPEARLLLEEGRQLRQGMGEALPRWLRGAPLPDASLFALNRCLAARATRLQVRQDGTGLEVSRVGLPSRVAGLLGPVAECFVALLTGVDPLRIRTCAHEDCDLWFRDTSRNGSRRWCSMARCGNKAKVAAHYRRRRGQGVEPA